MKTMETGGKTLFPFPFLYFVTGTGIGIVGNGYGIGIYSYMETNKYRRKRNRWKWDTYVCVYELLMLTRKQKASSTSGVHGAGRTPATTRILDFFYV